MSQAAASMWWAQQGDVAIKPCEGFPSGKKVVVASGALVESAVTQHTHRVTGKRAKVFKIGQDTFIEATHPFRVVHEEHKALEIPAGKYRIHAILEYDHFAEEARAVAD